MKRMEACLCGKPLAYEACCGVLHQGGVAADAEMLMRSRYVAYALGLEAYLLNTWHPETRPTSLDLSEPAMKWIGLDIRRHEQNGSHATVEFVARYKLNGRAYRMHEISRFVLEQGRWFYLDGTIIEMPK